MRFVYGLIQFPELLFLGMRFNKLQEEHPVIDIDDDMFPNAKHLRMSVHLVIFNGLD
jgi:hypothetical protein